MKPSTKTAIIAAGAGAAVVGMIAAIASSSKSGGSSQVQVLHGHRYRLSHAYPAGTSMPSVGEMQLRVDALMPNTWKIVSESMDADSSVGTFIADMIGSTHYESSSGGTIEDLGVTP